MSIVHATVIYLFNPSTVLSNVLSNFMLNASGMRFVHPLYDWNNAVLGIYPHTSSREAFGIYNMFPTKPMIHVLYDAGALGLHDRWLEWLIHQPNDVDNYFHAKQKPTEKNSLPDVPTPYVCMPSRRFYASVKEWWGCIRVLRILCADQHISSKCNAPPTTKTTTAVRWCRTKNMLRPIAGSVRTSRHWPISRVFATRVRIFCCCCHCIRAVFDVHCMQDSIVLLVAHDDCHAESSNSHQQQQNRQPEEDNAANIADAIIQSSPSISCMLNVFKRTCAHQFTSLKQSNMRDEIGWMNLNENKINIDCNDGNSPCIFIGWLVYYTLFVMFALCRFLNQSVKAARVFECCDNNNDKHYAIRMARKITVFDASSIRKT